MRQITKFGTAVIFAVSALAFTASTASAAIVCNGAGECWHVKKAYAYKPEFGVVVHPNHWRWARHEKYVWREHTGRGYWRNGVWVSF